MLIAIAEDDNHIRAYIAATLQDAGFACSLFGNGQEIITALQRETFDLVVVDWNMPKQSGLDVIFWARNNLAPCPPIIMMTSRSDSTDIVAALEAGADDYIIKPEQPAVLIARVRSAIRRGLPSASSSRYQAYGIFEFDRSRNSVSMEGKEVALTPKEFALAELFMQNGHRPLSRSYILQTVWKSVADTRTLDMHVSRIRSKLALQPENGFRLQTVFGYGYRFEVLEDQQ